MNNPDSLIMMISDNLNIKIGESEDKNQWAARCVYSAIGILGLASLYDELDENEGTISNKHFTEKVRKLADAYFTIFPYVRDYIQETAEDFSTDIYDIYIHTGFLYNKPYHISPPKRICSALSGISFLRGIILEKGISLSGIGTYSIGENFPAENLDFHDMFQIDKRSLAEVYSDISRNPKWSEIQVPDYTEYLVLSNNFRDGYWCNRPSSGHDISLLRYGLGEKTYSLYTTRDGKLYTSPLKRWQYENEEHFGIAAAILDHENLLPPSKYHDDHNVVNICLGYRLPCHEHFMFMLYSWPHGPSGNDNVSRLYNRDMSPEVFYALKPLLETRGYKFREV